MSNLETQITLAPETPDQDLQAARAAASERLAAAYEDGRATEIAAAHLAIQGLLPKTTEPVVQRLAPSRAPAQRQFTGAARRIAQGSGGFNERNGGYHRSQSLYR